jgi:glycosyltransferase involved in cell wall biosynthesis
VPGISFVTVVEPRARPRLAATIESLQAQTSPDWEHVVRDAGDDGLASANDALAAANREFVAFLDPGDRLHPDATARLLATIGDEVDLVYTDEDEVDPHGRKTNPFYKPAWSPDRLRCQPYIGRLAALRRAVVIDVGGLRPGLTGAEEHDLLLRATEQARRVTHLPEVLYHRGIPADRERVLSDASRRCIAEHLARAGFAATVDADPHHGVFRLQPAIPEPHPLVSIVIPTAGRSRMVHGAPLNLVVNCVESIVKRSTYRNYEVVCVIGDDADDTTRAALAQLGGDRLRFVANPGAFNYSRAINRGAVHARGEYLLLLNDDTQVITPDWIESMLMFAREDAVGAVGAKLLFGDGRIQHAGIIAIGRGGAGHPYYGFPGSHRGYADNLLVPGEYLAVTGACMLTARDRFEAVGGFTTSLPLNYNDIDYCLKLRHRDLRVVYSPGARLYHFELSSRVSGRVEPQELELLLERWGTVLEDDPFYNPNFLPSTDFLPPIRNVDEVRRGDVEPSLPAAALPRP